jgi:serine acetyltransferase
MMVADTAHIKMHHTRKICAGVDIGVGSGAVLREDVPDFATVAGVSAQIIGWRKS